MRKLRNLGAFERRVVYLCVVLFGAFFLLFSKLPSQIAAMEKQREWDADFYEFAALFSEIYNDIRNRYVDDVDSKQLFEGAVRGMFSTLDPHSQWLAPESLNQLEKDTEGQFSGVGLHITLRDGVLTVIAPIPGTPAARAGVMPWDRIVEIDDEKTEGYTLLEAVKKLTGTSGTKVDIKVFREGESELLEMTLVRAQIKIDSVHSTVMDGNLGYLRIARWSEKTADDVRGVLKDFKKQELEGLIVDLRYNTGGLLDKVVEVCDYFLPDGQLIVSTKGRREDSNRSFLSERDPLTDLPMIVLVNRGSASASEIFAGAMQDTDRGRIVSPENERTFGKGSVQTISYLRHSLEREEASGELMLSGMRLTTARYYTPSGRTIHEKGITADFEVPISNDERRQLLMHGLYGDPDTTGPENEDSESSDSPEGETPEEQEFRDTQLEAGIEYLRLILKEQAQLAKS